MYAIFAPLPFAPLAVQHIQWGFLLNGMLTVLPIAFNNRGYTLVATANGDVSNSGSVRVVKALSKNQIQIISEKQPSDAMGSYWIAIGE
ncbi:gp53-like domain-containing protein [Megasphaera stantonii]|uniref:gp53-like domain-containing protein n=1 Tax=Megasphaera stantonii TaxID=2144175 RepID=UPI003B96934D